MHLINFQRSISVARLAMPVIGIITMMFTVIWVFSVYGYFKEGKSDPRTKNERREHPRDIERTVKETRSFVSGEASCLTTRFRWCPQVAAA
jgi:hypothetical protein